MDSFKLVFLFTLVSFATTKAHGSTFYGSSCLGKTVTPNSTLQLNLKTLLFYLSSNAIGNKDFYNTTVIGRNHSDDTLYGSFMCRGDVPSQVCGQCVLNATQKLSSDPYCYLSTEASIWYDECMVRYSNHSFFSTVDLSSPSCSWSTDPNATNQASFKHMLYDTLKQTADEAANHSIGVKKYATKQARISGFQTLYCLAQCTPDLSPKDCKTCLDLLISNIEQGQGCKGSQLEVRTENLSCNIRYDVYPFYRPTASPPKQNGLVPTTNSSNTDSEHSQDRPGYLSHNCSTKDPITANSTFLSNLKILLSSLSSKATTKTGFYKTTIYSNNNPSDTVNGLFMCRGDLSPSHCQLCVLNATQRISLECSSSKEAIIWYNHCLLRYSHRSIFSTIDKNPTFHEFTVDNTSNLNQQQSFFTWSLADIVAEVQIDTWESSSKNYGTRSVKLDDFRTLYILAQCTPDLSLWDCNGCLKTIARDDIPWCCLTSPNGKVLYPSCSLMFGLSQFYGDANEAEVLKPDSTFTRTTGEVLLFKTIFA